MSTPGGSVSKNDVGVDIPGSGDKMQSEAPDQEVSTGSTADDDAE